MMQELSNKPEVTFYMYDAGHGFSCNDRASYHIPSADLAYKRTLEFIAKHA